MKKQREALASTDLAGKHKGMELASGRNGRFFFFFFIDR